MTYEWVGVDLIGSEFFIANTDGHNVRSSGLHRTESSLKFGAFRAADCISKNRFIFSRVAANEKRRAT